MHLARLGSKPGLERIATLLQIMGNPQQDLRCVHIAGTNGKGSTSLIIASALTKCGYKVGRYNSPHLHFYLERITIDGVEIPAGQLQEILDDIEFHVQTMLDRGQEHPTEFEVLTAAAFQYFHQQAVDLVVLEVGMGGSFDSTNVITPLVAVITGIDYDHTAFLGNTLAEIAVNKAGIIKSMVPVVVGEMGEEPMQVVKEIAHQLQSPLLQSRQINITHAGPSSLDGQVLDLIGPDVSLTGVRFALPGEYQLGNLATAVQTLLVLKKQGLNISVDDIGASLADLKMPGRLEVVNRAPLVIVDAAHNPQGARALAGSLEFLLPGRPKVVVCGLLDDKEREGILKALAEHTKAVIVTQPEGSRSNDWEQVAQAWREMFPFIPVEIEECIEKAVVKSMLMARDTEFVVITGSFYVIDRARRVFIK